MPGDDERDPVEDLVLVSYDESHRWRTIVNKLLGDGVELEAARRAGDNMIRERRRRIAAGQPSTAPPPPTAAPDDEESFG